MSRYLIRRLLQAIPTFFGITLLTFVIVYSAPGDPVLQLTFVPNQRQFEPEHLRHMMGLDQPIPVQYVVWLIGNEWQNDSSITPRRGILRGDLGRSFQTKRPVLDMIGERVGATLLLTGMATLIGYLLGIPVGVYSAVKRGGVFDNVTRVLAVLFNAIPSFWLSLLIILIFAVKFSEWGLPAIPSGGMYTLMPSVEKGPHLDIADRLIHLLPPALVLAAVPMARVSRLMRSQVLEVINQDYIRTALAKGLPERAVYFAHALRNALIPLATVLGPTLATLINGSIITETVWSWPGMGRLLIQSTFQRDYPVIMAGFVIGAAAVILGNLLSDVLYGVVDPRVRLE